MYKLPADCVCCEDRVASEEDYFRVGHRVSFNVHTNSIINKTNAIQNKVVIVLMIYSSVRLIFREF